MRCGGRRSAARHGRRCCPRHSLCASPGVRQLKHPNIVQFRDFFDEPTMYYLVTELMTGGELFDRIVEKVSHGARWPPAPRFAGHSLSRVGAGQEYYSEKEARDVVRTMAQAIAYCHEHNIVHRDLKVRVCARARATAAGVQQSNDAAQPENILLTSSNDDATIKIADFGFAKKVEGGGLKTACGTPGCVSATATAVIAAC